MKQFAALSVAVFLVGCGADIASSPGQAEGELGTREAAVCNGCPSGDFITSKYCDSSCEPSNNCNSAYSGFTCVTPDGVNPISICANGCPSGYYVASRTVTDDCKPGILSSATRDNRVYCVPIPAPGGPTYTQCGGSITACGTGYYNDSAVFTYTSACDPTANNSGSAANTVSCVPKP